MTGSRPESVLDPLCGMAIDVAKTETAGLTLKHEGRTYAFCRSGCLRVFQEKPDVHAAKAARAHAIGVPQPARLPVIDAGMRCRYESCSCCLSATHPDIITLEDGWSPRGRP